MADQLSSPVSSIESGRRWAFPSWAISLVLHVGVLLALLLTFPNLPSGAATEATRDVGLVLRQDGPQGEEYYDGEQDENNADSVASTAAASQSDSDLLNENPPADPSDALPAPRDEVLGLGARGDAADQLLPGAGQLTQGAGLKTTPSRGQAKTSVFGLPGEGYKFVYVFDRSGSMGGGGRSTLSAAKSELLKSLDSLGDTHQFQIIFYNEEPDIMKIAGGNRLVFGTEQNKTLARRFVGGITADGSTHHEEALLMALRLKPDVIFFLTDADEPALTPNQLRRIRQMCDGVTSINAIEFGLGPSLGAENFLSRLARENGGRYAYFDISVLGRSE
jgi:hypothetical protein